MKYFFNCTQHKLTEDQLKEASVLWFPSLDVKVLSLEDVFPSDVIERLKNSPSNKEQLDFIVEDFCSFLQIFVTNNGIFNPEHFAIHFPIGSPAFMYLLREGLDAMFPGIRVLFSHTERVVEEKDGKKVVEFKFSHFIEI